MTTTHDRQTLCDRCRKAGAEEVWYGGIDPHTGYPDSLYLCPTCAAEWDGNIPPTYQHETDEPCKSDGTPIFPKRKLTRHEQQQAAADRGYDTPEEYDA